MSSASDDSFLAAGVLALGFLAADLAVRMTRPARLRDAGMAKLRRDSSAVQTPSMRTVVGFFRLCKTFRRKVPTREIAGMSDKSDMPTVDQVRQTVARALEKAGKGPVAVAEAMGVERNYIRDFLQGKKSSLRTEVMLDLSERFGIPFKDLVVTRKKAKSRGV